MKSKAVVIVLFALSLLSIGAAAWWLESLRGVLRPILADLHGQNLVIEVSQLIVLQKNLGLIPLFVMTFIYAAGVFLLAGSFVMIFRWRTKLIIRNEN